MRFHKLEIENIKNLKGKHVLDLDLEFGSEELFLIYGEMGTGKTTIFDSISLALFGQTPKLQSPHGSPKNDSIRYVLNESSTSCSVSLVFSFQESHFFRAGWSFRLTSSGKTTAPNRMLERLDKDFQFLELLYSGSKAKDAKAIFSHTLYGLEFADFTRSVLLPQGQFAKFIEVDPKDRIDILERITNTQIYAEIADLSKKRRHSKKDELDTLKSEVLGLPSLVEVQNMRKYRKANESKITYIQQKKEAKKHTVVWSEHQKKDAHLQSLLKQNEARKEALSVESEQLQENLMQAEERWKNAQNSQQSFQNFYTENQARIDQWKKDIQSKTQYEHQHAHISRQETIWTKKRAAFAKTEIPSQQDCERAQKQKQEMLCALKEHLGQLTDGDGVPNKHLQESLMDRYQTRLDLVRSQLKLMEELRVQHLSLQKNRRNHARYVQTLKELQKEEEQCIEKMAAYRADILRMEKQHRNTLLDIEMYQHRLRPHELRAQLKPGEPCIVCGSKEHPYAGEEGDHKELENRLLEHQKHAAAQIKELKEKRKQVEDTSKTKGAVSVRVHNGKETILELNAGISMQEKEIQAGLQELHLESVTGIEPKKEVFLVFKQTLEGTYREYEQASSKYADLLSKYQVGRQHVEEAQRIDQKLQEWSVQKEEFYQSIQTLTQQIEDCEKDVRKYFSLPKEQELKIFWTEKPHQLAGEERTTLAEKNLLQKQYSQRKTDLQTYKEQSEKIHQQRADISAKIMEQEQALETIFASLHENPDPISPMESIPLFPPDSSIEERHQILMELPIEQELVKIQFDQERYGQSIQQYEQNKSKIEEVHRCEEEFQAWDQLQRALNNGISFRYFAQTVMLQNLIDRANTQLREIMSNYLLSIRTDQNGSPLLDFNIAQMSGGERPIRTLSGGETFLLALSFALALANLRKIHMPIQTLLIDEGFGHLDSESVTKVIGGLETLKKRNIQVGLISHVAALQERIAARINVKDIKL